MRYRFLFILFILISSICLTSCEKESHDPDLQLSGDITEYIPPYSFELNCSYSVSGKYFQLSVIPIIRIDMDFWGLHIDEVEYYIDDRLLAIVKKAPYSFFCSTMLNGTHTIKANFIISGETINTVVFPVSELVYFSK